MTKPLETPKDCLVCQKDPRLCSKLHALETLSELTVEEVLLKYGNSEAQEVFAQEGYGANKFMYSLDEAKAAIERLLAEAEIQGAIKARDVLNREMGIDCRAAGAYLIERYNKLTNRESKL